jgi:hypothetical protein
MSAYHFRIHSSNIYELVIELQAVILSLVSLRAEVIIWFIRQNKLCDLSLSNDENGFRGSRDETLWWQGIRKHSVSWNLPKLSHLWLYSGGFGQSTTETKQFVSGTRNSSRLSACMLRNQQVIWGHHPRLSSMWEKLLSGALRNPTHCVSRKLWMIQSSVWHILHKRLRTKGYQLHTLYIHVVLYLGTYFCYVVCHLKTGHYIILALNVRFKAYVTYKQYTLSSHGNTGCYFLKASACSMLCTVSFSNHIMYGPWNTIKFVLCCREVVIFRCSSKLVMQMVPIILASCMLCYLCYTKFKFCSSR